jgi:AraC-like DNA-binding protein
MRTSTAATPIAFVRSIVLAYRKYGVDPGEALRHAGITPAQQHSSAADVRVTAAQLEALSGFAMRELDDEALGWFSRKLPWGSYGMLCRASITSPNLGVALKRWCRHHALLTDDVELRLTVSGDSAQLSIDEPAHLGAMREFCLVTLLRNVHGIASWLIDSRIPLQQVTFPFDRPRHSDAYALMFPGPVAFGASAAGFAFDAKYLGLPLRRDEKALQAMLQRALPLIVFQYRRDRLLVHRVRDLLRAKPVELGTAHALAGALHVSVRTLHRHLSDEGSSLQELKDDVRREQAIDLLCRTSRSIKQVALAIGFSNEKSFSRAFRQWTNDTPAAFRERSG